MNRIPVLFVVTVIGIVIFFFFFSLRFLNAIQHDTTLAPGLSYLNVHSFEVSFSKIEIFGSSNIWKCVTSFHNLKEKHKWLLNSKTNGTTDVTILYTAIAIGNSVVCQRQRSIQHILINSWQTIEVLARFPSSVCFYLRRESAPFLCAPIQVDKSFYDAFDVLFRLPCQPVAISRLKNDLFVITASDTIQLGYWVSIEWSDPTRSDPFECGSSVFIIIRTNIRIFVLARQ